MLQTVVEGADLERDIVWREKVGQPEPSVPASAPPAVLRVASAGVATAPIVLPPRGMAAADPPAPPVVIPAPRAPEPGPVSEPSVPGGSYKFTKPSRRVTLVIIAVAVVFILGIVLGTTIFRTGADSLTSGPIPLPPAPPAVTSMDIPTVGATLSVGNGPEAVAFSPDGTRAYVTGNTGAQVVSVIDAATGAVSAVVPAPGPPQFIGISPDRSKAALRVGGLS